jgi:hypothetical protein
VGSESYEVSRFIDSYLQPIVIKLNSYVRDTDHFQALIQDIKVPSNEEVHLFTMDVASLYTNIPTDEGVTCINRAFREHPDTQRPDVSLLTLLRLVLERNDFEFDKKWYLQIKGTAMGKSFAPSYSNIFMGYWEQEGLATYAKTPTVWLRFIDDIFGVWMGRKEELLGFFEHMNSLNPSIRLDFHHSTCEVNFLDTSVLLEKAGDFLVLRTKVFFKDTDSRCLINRGSFHPKSLFRGVIKSQMLRYAIGALTNRTSTKQQRSSTTTWLPNRDTTEGAFAPSNTSS